MASRLGIYNAALRHLGERRLASLTEDREPRYLLDEVYSDVANYCLEQGFWNFAMRAVQLSSSSTIEPGFGFLYAFEKPADMVRPYEMSAFPEMRPPLLNIREETTYWAADWTTIYIRYVSSGADYGMNLAAWPSSFRLYVELFLAWSVAHSLTSYGREDLMKEVARALKDARTKDALREPPGFPPLGTWGMSRLGSNSNRWRTRGPIGGSIDVLTDDFGNWLTP
jgi:hypothetical protein